MTLRNSVFWKIQKFYITARWIQAHAKRATKGRQESEETCKEGLQVVTLFILIISYHLYESYDMSHILAFPWLTVLSVVSAFSCKYQVVWISNIIISYFTIIKINLRSKSQFCFKKHVPEYVLTFILIPSGFICIDTLCLQFDSKLLSCNKFFLLQLFSIFMHYKIKQRNLGDYRGDALE